MAGLLAAVLVTTCLFGCGNKTETTGTNTGDGVKTITFWSPSPHSKTLYVKLANEFNESTGKEKGINFVYEIKESNMTQAIDLALAADQAPELFVGGNVEALASKGDIMAFDDVKGAENLVARFEDRLVPFTNTYNGKTYTLPVSSTINGLVYNKDMFKAAGIVDDMMNMKLPMWAYEETGHSFYRSVYTNHIENSIKTLIRDDYSVRHAYHFDARSGSPLTEMNYCGYSIGTHWARGTAWMIYGLTAVLMHTGANERYFLPLKGVAEKYISLLGDDLVPVWDFRLPEGAPHMTDTSAAVIAASAFLDFDKLNIKDEEKNKYRNIAENTLNSICENYMAEDSAENVINGGQSGNNESGTIWGDYFFTELLMKKLHGDNLQSFWL